MAIGPRSELRLHDLGRGDLDDAQLRLERRRKPIDRGLGVEEVRQVEARRVAAMSDAACDHVGLMQSKPGRGT